MANLLYAWEFGTAYGHMGAFLPLGLALRNRRHEVNFAIAQVTAADKLLGAHGFRWMQSPVMPEMHIDRPPLSYSDILLRFGYAHPDTLMGLTVAWRELIRLTGTRLVMPDHAPTAILAARTLGIPILTYSYGFCVPPSVSPTPNMRPWMQVDPALLVEIDRVVLHSMNAVLERFGCPALPNVASLFGVEEPSMMTFPELDHYVDCRGSATYWGSLVATVAGAPAQWPAGNGPRIFAYLRPDIRHAEALLAALVALKHPALIVFPDIPDSLLARYRAPHLTFSKTPLDTASILSQADLAITYGGHGLTSAFLLAGKPLLLLPGQLEQFLLARRVEQMGAGLLVDPEQPADRLPQQLQRVLSDPFFAGNARAFAQKYAAFPQETVVANLVRRIEEICTS